MIEMSSKNNVFRKGMTPIAPSPSVQHMDWVFTHGSYVGRYEAQVLSPPIQKNDPEERRERSCPASQAGVVQDESSASARIAKKQVHALVVQVSKQIRLLAWLWKNGNQTKSSGTSKAWPARACFAGASQPVGKETNHDLAHGEGGVDATGGACGQARAFATWLHGVEL